MDPEQDPADTDNRLRGEVGAATGDIPTGRLRNEDVLDQPASPAAGLTLRGLGGGQGVPVLAEGYRTGGTIGTGAMANILEADQQTLWRTVAIKTLKPERRTPNDQRSFLAESIATAKLEHPNIVPVHDLVRDESGHLQLVMKRVVGRTWKDLLHPQNDADEAAADELDLDDHLEFLLKICDAVAYAHAFGILHRDLKPENVMVGDFGEVLVMDWGCAVTYGDYHVAGMSHLTELETISGTPNYIAPEMARGDDSRTGPWSDVYLLGGMLYEVLTGEAPHHGKTVRDVLARAARGKVPPPRHRNPARAMPDELVELCTAALAANIDERIQGVKEFASELRNYRKHGEAYRLAEAAREQLRVAKQARASQAGRHYRRAVACCEQALDMWPERSIQMLTVRALLEAAGDAVATGDLGVAASDARAAEALAEELGFEDQARKAAEILVLCHQPAEQADRRFAALELTITKLRFLAAALLALAVLGTALGAVLF
ncbi:MAG: serine/threonine-protein kinase [Planctomycetota bacterium]|jgi:tRNA A-37 threonylcarbamoyl transferase component Bud32|nr:serine/threonine-protein kinase [Planctomycetota bacterium]